jgi:hypothetical protein
MRTSLGLFFVSFIVHNVSYALVLNARRASLCFGGSAYYISKAYIRIIPGFLGSSGRGRGSPSASVGSSSFAILLLFLRHVGFKSISGRPGVPGTLPPQRLGPNHLPVSSSTGWRRVL